MIFQGNPRQPLSGNKVQDIDWMQQALDLAKQAEVDGEVPVGAVIVHQDQCIATGYNQPILANDPTAHAEIVALRNAAIHLNNYRLLDTIMYVTLEPCAMCAMAMIHARVGKIIYGASDPKTGALGGYINLLDWHWNHKPSVEMGVLNKQCAHILKNFFAKKR